MHANLSEIMKKRTYFAIMVCVLVGFSSCNYYPKETVYESNFKTLGLRVRASDWQDGGGFYYCGFNVPELTAYIYDNGIVTCSHEYDNGTKFLLPQTIHNEDADGNRYTTTIDFLFSVGYVEIGITNNDFINNAPEDMFFRLNMVW